MVTKLDLNWDVVLCCPTLALWARPEVVELLERRARGYGAAVCVVVEGMVVDVVCVEFDG